MDRGVNGTFDPSLGGTLALPASSVPRYRASMNIDGEMPGAGGAPRSGAVDLYWIPLGAGGHVVRLSGRLFEAISAGVQRRERRDLYHTALEVVAPEGRFVIEMAPIPDGHGQRRGVVVEGAVGTRIAGRFRLFRYEIRRWRDGAIPDASAAVSSPIRLTESLAVASSILDLVPSVPALRPPSRGRVPGWRAGLLLARGDRPMHVPA